MDKQSKQQYVETPQLCGVARPKPQTKPVEEIGGRKDGSDPTRYGDYEKGGRCVDF